MKCALLVVDMSQEQLYPGDGPFLPKDWPGYQNILKMSELLPRDRVLDCRLWMAPEDHSTLADLYSIGRANTPGSELVSQLRGLKATFVKKLQYSAFYGSELENLLKASEVTDIILTGINTDYCILATALDAFYRGFKVFLVEDACFTFNGKSGHTQGLRDFERFLNEYGIVVTTADALRILQAPASDPL